MVTLKDVLRYVPLARGEILRKERHEERQRRYREKRNEVSSKANRVRNKVLTISPEQFASMQGRKIDDYEPVGVQTTSPETNDPEYSRDYALVNLSEVMDKGGIEYVVSVNFETTTSGMGTIINPNGYRTSVYGTGMRLRR